MFRPFETAVSQYGCQMFSYLEYIFVLAFRIFRKCLTRCLDFFELVTLQGYGISSSGRKRGTSFYNLSPVCVQRRGMVFDPSVLKNNNSGFQKGLTIAHNSHRKSIYRTTSKFTFLLLVVCSLHSWKSTSVEIIG